MSANSKFVCLFDILSVGGKVHHTQWYDLFLLFWQMTSNDKDFRFMATNDLMTELQKDNIKLDDDSEKKVCRMVLKLLEDKNGEVQNLAVKWWVFVFGFVKLFANIYHDLAWDHS